MEPITAVAKHLKENALSLANKIVDDIHPRFEHKASIAEIDQAKKVYTEFLEFLGSSIVSGEESIHMELLEWSRKNGEVQAGQQMPISSVLTRYPSTRSVFIDHLTAISMAYELPVMELVNLNKRFNYLLDISLNETVFAFERSSDQIIQESQNRINEVSAPIVAVQEGIAVLPLIGLIDAERAQYLLEQAVPKLPSYEIECLITDFSGILNIDNQAAELLMKIYATVKLLGINVITTGIRPDIAQTVVNKGIKFSNVKSYATVRQALESINKKA